MNSHLPSRPSWRRTVAMSGVAAVAIGALSLGMPAAGFAASATSASAGLRTLAPITLSGSITVSGDDRVGSPLTAISTVVPSQGGAILSGTWLRDGIPIPGATGFTYTPGTDDVGATLAYQQTASLLGLADVSLLSSLTGPILPALPDSGSGSGSGNPVNLPTLPVTGGIDLLGGTAVGQTLEAVSTALTDPASTGVGQWLRDGAPIPGATDPTYLLQGADLGHLISYRKTFDLLGYLDVTVASASTVPITIGTFGVGPLATISGQTKVGSVLTADGGTPSPVADSFTYQWFADGAAIDGATQRTLLLGPAQRHTRITVGVTALRLGFASLTNTSTATAPIATELAPTLRLSTNRSRVTLRSAATLSWHSVDAVTLSSSGGWSGTRPAEGTARVRPTRLGTTTYVLRATNENGTTTNRVVVKAVPAPKTLPVTVTGGRRTLSRTLRVHGGGLYPHEFFAIRVARTKVATGHASARGVVNRTIHLRRAARAGQTQVLLTGMVANRVGHTAVRTSSDRRLGLRVGKRVRAQQVATVTRLAPGEQVRVHYLGRQIAPGTALANANGTFTIRFATGARSGTRAVRVYGTFSHRGASATFRVLAH